MLRALAALLLLSACWEVTRPSLPPNEAPGAPPAPTLAPPVQASAVVPIDETPEAAAFVPPPPLQIGPVLGIEEVVGTTAGIASMMIAPALVPLKECGSKTKGKLIIRVIAQHGRTHLRIVDQGQLEEQTAVCVLQALSTIDVEPALQQSPSRSDAPAHIETQLGITW